MAESKQIRKAVELEVARKLEQRAKTWLKAAKEQGGASSTTRVVVNELLAVADQIAGKRARKINTRVEEPAPESVVIEGATLFNADNIHVLRSLPSCSVDALVLDPPSGIAFMSKQWDRDKGGRDGWVGWFAEVMTECYRVMKPGAHALVWALPRTSHWTSLAIEQAEFEIRDILMHVFGTGFPKSANVGLRIDAEAGATREVVGSRTLKGNAAVSTKEKGGTYISGAQLTGVKEIDITAPATAEAKQWAGWGTALKPSHEAWILARKPLAGTVAATVLEHGTGALNIDGCRVGWASSTERAQVNARTGPNSRHAPENSNGATGWGAGRIRAVDDITNPGGRWPPHLLLSHGPDCGETCADGCPVAEMDAQSGPCTTGGGGVTRANPGLGTMSGPSSHADRLTIGYGDTGGASRFFPVFRSDTAPGRWPPHLLLSHAAACGETCEDGCPVAEMDAQSGVGVSRPRKDNRGECSGGVVSFAHGSSSELNDTGGASRFFPIFRYVAKASTRERNAGCDDIEPKNTDESAGKVSRNHHPTLKSIDLMRWLVRLITPPNGVVLDCFMGSGTTGIAATLEGARFIGIEREPDYFEIACARIEHHTKENT